MTSRSFRTAAAAAASVALTLGLAACSSSGPAAQLTKQQHHADTSIALPTAKTSAAQVGKVSQINVRYANFFVHKHAAGPAIDLYEGQTGAKGALLVRDLAYGTISSYVHPHLVPNQVVSSQGLITLPIYAVPTGEDPLKAPNDVHGLSALIDDGSHPQMTMVLQGEKDTIESGPLGGLSFSDRLEKGKFNGTNTPDIPPAGTTEILADATSVTAYPNLIGAAYLMVDSDCKAPANGDSAEPDLPAIFPAEGGVPKSTFAVFPEQTGAHQIAVATTDISDNLTCAKLTQRQGQASTTLTDGQQIEAYVYGPSATDLHVAFAPVQA